jgi:hypothetical protein
LAKSALTSSGGADCELGVRGNGLALRRGEYVEFPFGYLKAEKRLSRRWQAIGDEPMRPYFVDHFLDEWVSALWRGRSLLPGLWAGAGGRTNNP